MIQYSIIVGNVKAGGVVPGGLVNPFDNTTPLVAISGTINPSDSLPTLPNSIIL